MRTRRLALGTLAAILVATAAYAAYTAIINGTGTATSQLGATQPDTDVTLHFTFDASTLTPGGTIPITGPGPNQGITADVTGGGTALINTITLGTITTSDPTNCLPAWFTVTGLPVNPSTNSAFPKMIQGNNYEVLPPAQGVNGQLPQLHFLDNGNNDQDTCRIGSGTETNPNPDTITVTLLAN